MREEREEIDPLLKYAMNTGELEESSSSHNTNPSNDEIMFVGQSAIASAIESTFLPDSSTRQTYNLTTEEEEVSVQQCQRNTAPTNLAHSTTTSLFTAPLSTTSLSTTSPSTTLPPIKWSELQKYATEQEKKQVNYLSYAACEAEEMHLSSRTALLQERQEIIAQIKIRKAQQEEYTYKSKEVVTCTYNSERICPTTPTPIYTTTTTPTHTTPTTPTPTPTPTHTNLPTSTFPSTQQVAPPFSSSHAITPSLPHPPTPPSFTTHSAKRALVCLQAVFRLQSFRQNQKEIIEKEMEGKDVFVLMPTGGGKSLTFQLPAILSEGVTIVVSPLLALIQDQIKNLAKKGIPALAINSNLSKTDRALAMRLLTSSGSAVGCAKYTQTRPPLVKLFYVTPELLVASRTLHTILGELCAQGRLARFVIDEAHCVSQWGHDFRPDYTQMFLLREQYPSVPITALTATATPAVQKDILNVLRIKGCFVFSQSFNRPNLQYSIVPKTANPLTDLVSFIETHYPLDSGIIYCLSKKDCEWLSDALNTQYKLRTGYYHAGLGKKERMQVAQRWDTSQILVIVATIAFGMGIDKKDVRYVIHYSLPKSLEGYYQETGRAGRDQLESECILYYNYSDKKKIEFMIAQGETTPEAKQRQKAHLRSVIAYCENKVDCRRHLLLHYFGESFLEGCNGGCDNCRRTSAVQEIDCLSEALKIQEIIKKHVHITENKLITECRKHFSTSKDLLSRIIRWMVVHEYLDTKLIIGARGFSWSYLQIGKGVPSSVQIISTEEENLLPPAPNSNHRSASKRMERSAKKVTAEELSLGVAEYMEDALGDISGGRNTAAAKTHTPYPHDLEF